MHHWNGLDYCFLEDAQRLADSASRHNGVSYDDHKHKLLQRECRRRDISIRFMPAELKRHQQSQTTYVKKRKAISWTVEWAFEIGGLVVDRVIQHRILESQKPIDALSNMLKDCPGNSELRFRLKPFCAATQYAMRLKMEHDEQKSTPSTPFEAIDSMLSFTEILKNHTIIEFPTIHVSVS